MSEDKSRTSRDCDHIMAAIDSYKAADIARKFFEQYHSGVEIKDMELKDNKVWVVTVGVGFLFEQIKEVEIDASTGTIVQYH